MLNLENQYLKAIWQQIARKMQIITLGKIFWWQQR